MVGEDTVFPIAKLDNAAKELINPSAPNIAFSKYYIA